MTTSELTEVEAAGLEKDWLLVAGGALLAVLSFAAMLYAAYHGWYAQDLAVDWAYGGIGFGFLFFALGAFVFAYGWTAGDMEKSLRLTFFICVLALATVLALVLILKSRGGAAKGAAGVGTAAGEASGDGFDALPLIHAVGSMLIPEEEPEPEDTQAAEDEPFSVTCRGCGARFAPVPPRALCPFCNEAALAV